MNSTEEMFEFEKILTDILIAHNIYDGVDICWFSNDLDMIIDIINIDSFGHKSLVDRSIVHKFHSEFCIRKITGDGKDLRARFTTIDEMFIVITHYILKNKGNCKFCTLNIDLIRDLETFRGIFKK